MASSHGVYSENWVLQGGKWWTRAAVGGGSAPLWWASKSSLMGMGVVIRGWREHGAAEEMTGEEVLDQMPMR